MIFKPLCHIPESVTSLRHIAQALYSLWSHGSRI